MPPFDSEPPENEVKTSLPFLKLGRPKAAPREAFKAFGCEPAEIVKAPPSKLQKVDPVTERSVGFGAPFGEEPDEDVQPWKSLKVKPSGSAFQDEPAEDSGQDSNSTSGDEVFVPKQTEAVFACGWQAIAAFQGASFWKTHQDDPKAAKQKRSYDNSKRSSAAAGKTEGKVFEKNGTDPERLSSLFAAPTCHCDLNARPIVNRQKLVCVCEALCHPVLRCEQGLLQGLCQL